MGESYYSEGKNTMIIKDAVIKLSQMPLERAELILSLIDDLVNKDPYTGYAEFGELSEEDIAFLNGEGFSVVYNPDAKPAQSLEDTAQGFYTLDKKTGRLSPRDTLGDGMFPYLVFLNHSDIPSQLKEHIVL